MAEVTVNLNNRPADSEIEVPILGLFKNGTTTQIDEGRWERYKNYRGEGNYPEDGKIVFSTEQVREEAEVRAEAEEAVAAVQDLDELKKDELVALADARGIDSTGLNKGDLIHRLKEAGE